MQKAKEALLAAGRIEKVGKGRISLDNHAWLAEQCAAGVKFSDYVPKATAKVNKPRADGRTEVHGNANASTNEKNLAELFIRYPEANYTAKETESGKPRSMRSACNGCGLSLIGHTCDSPAIVATDGTRSVAVTIERK